MGRSAEFDAGATHEGQQYADPNPTPSEPVNKPYRRNKATLARFSEESAQDRGFASQSDMRGEDW